MAYIRNLFVNPNYSIAWCAKSRTTDFAVGALKHRLPSGKLGMIRKKAKCKKSEQNIICIVTCRIVVSS